MQPLAVARHGSPDLITQTAHEDRTMTQLTMNISGMTCGHCVSSVTRALKGLDGVAVEQVTLGKATVSYDPVATSPTRIAEAIEEEGYRVLSAR
jgi:copper chaperone